MNLEIKQATRNTIALVDTFDRSFVVNSRLVLSAADGQLRTQIVPVPNFIKTYPRDEIDYTTFLDHPDKVIFLAYRDARAIGQIVLLKSWNRYGYVQSLNVDAPFRGGGVGQALLEKGIEWARQKNLPGVMLETQDINVSACKLYERAGFRLGGFDKFLYTPFHMDPPETALYWYLIFSSAA